MGAEEHYLFTSRRLGFRGWREEDILPMAQINADPEVMAFFPGVQTIQQTADFVKRMQAQQASKGYCYFAVDRLDNNEFIGFVGLVDQSYEADFTPCVDIGWRLKRSAWNIGFAKEGAVRCLAYAFTELALERIYAVAPKVNLRSEHIMQVAGMKKIGEFLHPLLRDDQRLGQCILYAIDSEGYMLTKTNTT